MRTAYRVRLAVNLVNGSTLAGLLAAAAGRATLARAADGLLVGSRYRLPVPVAPAFTVGNVILPGATGRPSRRMGRCSPTRHGTPPSTRGAEDWLCSRCTSWLPGCPGG